MNNQTNTRIANIVTEESLRIEIQSAEGMSQYLHTAFQHHMASDWDRQATALRAEFLERFPNSRI